jgi:hypothetical protein
MMKGMMMPKGMEKKMKPEMEKMPPAMRKKRKMRRGTPMPDMSNRPTTQTKRRV